MNIKAMKWAAMMLASLLFILSLSGCSSSTKDASFAEMARAGQARTGAPIRLANDAAAVAGIRESVQSMLQDKLTSDQAVRIALVNNQCMQATYEEIGISRSQLLEAGLLKNPSISAELRFPKYVALPFEVDVVQSLVDALMIPLRKRAAAADYDATQGRVISEAVNMAADVRVAFFRAQGAAQSVELRQKIVTATGASLEAAHRLHDAGNVTDLFLLTQQAMDAQSRIDLASADGELQDAREALTGLMGLWGTQTQWSMDPHLPELPADEVKADGLESIAIRQRADLQAQEAQVQVAAAALDLTRRTAGISDLAVGGKVVQDPDGDLTAGPTVTVPLPIFNQGQFAIRAAQGRVAMARRRSTALAVQIRSEVRRDRDRLGLARQRAAYYAAVVLPLRRRIVQQTQLETNAMVVGVFELLTARQNEIDAARQWIEALRDYWTYRAELERALGGRLPAAVAVVALSTRPTTQPAVEKSQPDHSMRHSHEGAQ